MTGAMRVIRRLDLPPVWGALAAAVIWLWARRVHVLPAPPPLGLIGWGLVGLGLALILWAALLFVRKATPIEPRTTPRVLLTTGPFTLTRNPIYRGLILVVSGWALVCGELTGLAVTAAYATLLLHRFAIPEERVLEATFGAAFTAWRDRVRWRL